jgi:hypothetical protein
VKSWYDGFALGSYTDIYNPWSVLNYLDKRKAGAYWANSSSNSLVGKLIREGSADIKKEFEDLISSQSIITPIDEQIVYGELDGNEDGIWSLLLASGYLKVLHYEEDWESIEPPDYELTLTNREVKRMFYIMVRDWFRSSRREYNEFIKALLLVELAHRYTVTSNRESGFGRYDVMLEPKGDDDGMIMEFKVQDAEDEKDLSDTIEAALRFDREKLLR